MIATDEVMVITGLFGFWALIIGLIFLWIFKLARAENRLAENPNRFRIINNLSIKKQT